MRGKLRIRARRPRVGFREFVILLGKAECTAASWVMVNEGRRDCRHC